MSKSRERWIAWGALGAVVIYHLALLFEQVLHPEPFLNDSVLHFGMIRAIESAPSRGQSLLDPWVPTWVMGFPVFHYYQNLPHLAVVGLHKLAFGLLSLVRTFKIVEWLAIGTFPIPVYLAVRKLGFDRLGAVLAGTLAIWIRTNYLHGHDFESYVWQGLGQYAQAFGGWFFPLALAWSFVAVRDGTGLAKASLFLALTFLSHLALGYMAFLAAGLAVLTNPKELPRRALRLAAIAGVAIFASLYVVVPILRDFAYYNVSTLVPSWKYNSFGHQAILAWFFRGELFDYGRVGIGANKILAWPALTAIVGAGLVWAIARSRRESERYLLIAFLVFLALFFGRPTWGKLLDLLPLGSGFHYSRAIYPVHVIGTMLGGLALASGLRFLARLPAGKILAAVVAIVLLLPLAADRTAYLLRSARLVRKDAALLQTVRTDLEDTIAFARSDRLGRVYAGQGAAGSNVGWGGQFRIGHVPVYAWFPTREVDALGYLYHMWSFNSDLHDAFNESREADYHVFNVRRVIAPVNGGVPPFAEEVFRQGLFRVLEIDGPGFAELVDVPYSINVEKKNLSRLQRLWLRSPLPGHGVHPGIRLTEVDVPDPDSPTFDAFDFDFPDPAPAIEAGTIENVERVGEDFLIDVKMNRTAPLMLKVSYHPQWTVTIDGEIAEKMHVMPSYLGVQAPEGEHRVEFRYEPGPLKPVLAGLGILVLAGFFGVGRRLRL